MKSTDVYKAALARAQAHPSVIEALGSPIKEGFLVSGNKRERRIRRSEPVDSYFRAKWKRDDLRGSKQVAWSMELFGPHRRDHQNAPADRPSPESGSGEFALTTASATRDKKTFC